MNALDVVVLGSGMIVHDQFLPSLYHLQRIGLIHKIHIAGRDPSKLQALLDSQTLKDAFPGQIFIPLKISSDSEGKPHYKTAIGTLSPRQLVIVALPDMLHHQAITDALNLEQHIICVKPFVLDAKEALDIQHLAENKNLFVGIDYHKRFDHRFLIARKKYLAGELGTLAIGHAKMIEPRSYRHSNFQNWFTKDNTDPFTYVGCHYLDIVHFITQLKPVEVSVVGIEGCFPNQNQGYIWSQGRVIYENGAILSLLNGLGYPDNAAGSNEQCLHLFFEGSDQTALIKFDDQDRGCTIHDLGESANKHFQFINPDYFQLIPWEGIGFKPVGYGYRSIEEMVLKIGVFNAAKNHITEHIQTSLLATAWDSLSTVLATEAGRLSINHGGKPVKIFYGDTVSVSFKSTP